MKNLHLYQLSILVVVFVTITSITGCGARRGPNSTVNIPVQTTAADVNTALTSAPTRLSLETFEAAIEAAGSTITSYEVIEDQRRKTSAELVPVEAAYHSYDRNFTTQLRLEADANVTYWRTTRELERLQLLQGDAFVARDEATRKASDFNVTRLSLRQQVRGFQETLRRLNADFASQEGIWSSSLTLAKYYAASDIEKLEQIRKVEQRRTEFFKQKNTPPAPLATPARTPAPTPTSPVGRRTPPPESTPQSVQPTGDCVQLDAASRKLTISCGAQLRKGQSSTQVWFNGSFSGTLPKEVGGTYLAPSGSTPARLIFPARVNVISISEKVIVTW